MKLTPQEVITQEFGIHIRGFDKDEVKNFLIQVAETLESEIQEKEKLRKESERRKEALAKFERREEVLRDTLVSAQKFSNEIKTNAQKEAELIVKEGEIKAEKVRFLYFPFKAGKVLDCVAIFNKLDPGATDITITIDGLSNDLNLMKREDGSRQIESRIYVL